MKHLNKRQYKMTPTLSEEVCKKTLGTLIFLGNFYAIGALLTKYQETKFISCKLSQYPHLNSTKFTKI